MCSFVIISPCRRHSPCVASVPRLCFLLGRAGRTNEALKLSVLFLWDSDRVGTHRRFERRTLSACSALKTETVLPYLVAHTDRLTRKMSENCARTSRVYVRILRLLLTLALALALARISSVAS